MSKTLTAPQDTTVWEGSFQSTQYETVHGNVKVFLKPLDTAGDYTVKGYLELTGCYLTGQFVEISANVVPGGSPPSGLTIETDCKATHLSLNLTSSTANSGTFSYLATHPGDGGNITLTQTAETTITFTPTVMSSCVIC
jgi:hypothetical protein